MNSTVAVAARKPAPRAAGDAPVCAPVLRASHDRLRELGVSRTTSLAQIRRVVESDPAVALNLFADVNANLERAGHAPVSDIPRAILFTGMAELPARLTRANILDDAVPEPEYADLIRILRRAHHASRQARAIGSLTGGINAEELLAASLTREGLPYVKSLAGAPGSPLRTAAFENFLPAVSDGHDASALGARFLDLAARFAAATEEQWDDAVLEPLYGEIGELTGRDAGEVSKRLRLATLEAARNGPGFAVYPAAIHLMSPGRSTRVAAAPEKTSSGLKPRRAKPVADAPCASPSAAESTPAAAKTTTAAQKQPGVATGTRLPTSESPGAELPGADRRPDADALAAGLDRINAAAASGATAAAILPLALETLCAGTGMELACLFMRDRHSTDLRLCAHRGIAIASKYREVPITPSANPLLAKLLAKPAAFHWRPDRHRRMLDGLPLKLMGRGHGFFYGLHLNGRPIGILAACRPDGERPDAAGDFATFKQIGAATLSALRHSRRGR